MKIGKGTVGRALVTAVTLFSAVGASAAPVSGDFREELSFPSDPITFPSKILVDNGEPVAGSPDLSESTATTVINPEAFGGSLDVDLTSDGLLTLISRSDDPNNSFERIDIAVTNVVFNIAGQAITGLTFVGGTGLFTPGSTTSPTFGSSANSLSVSYANPTGLFFVDGGTATFQATFGVIPEPATGLLLGAGLAMGLVVPRRKAKADSKAPAQG